MGERGEKHPFALGRLWLASPACSLTPPPPHHHHRHGLAGLGGGRSKKKGSDRHARKRHNGGRGAKGRDGESHHEGKRGQRGDWSSWEEKGTTNARMEAYYKAQQIVAPEEWVGAEI